MDTIIMVYRLKDDDMLEEYKKWSIEVDQPLINSFERIREFNVFEVKGPENIWNIFEIIKIDAYDFWEEITATPQVKENTKQWSRFVDTDSVKLVFGKKIRSV